MDSGSLSRAFFDAFRRRDLDTMISMMAEDVRYELASSPVLTSATPYGTCTCRCLQGLATPKSRCSNPTASATGALAR